MKHKKCLLVLVGSLIFLINTACQPSVLPSKKAEPTPEISVTSLVQGSLDSGPGRSDERRGAQLDSPFTINGVILVNKKHPVSKNYLPTVTDEHRPMDPVARAALKELLKDASTAGFELTKNSAYRSFETQKEIFDSEAASIGEKEANKLTARPGESEHQTGLAVDLTDDNHAGASFSEAFGDLESGRWLAANAYKYGFILRYPKGKEAITGYNYEPWHFRYVGVDLAAKFGPNPSLTLEEYLGER